MENFIPSKDTLANDNNAHNAVMCAWSSQSCAWRSFFRVFYERNALAEVKDNNPDATLANMGRCILTHAMQVKQKLKVN